MHDRNIARMERGTRRRRWWVFRRPLEKRQKAVLELAALAEEIPDADKALQRVWQALVAERESELLVSLLESASGLDPAEWAPRLVEGLETAPIKNTGTDGRLAITKALKDMGDKALEPLVGRILNPGEEGARWALVALREIGLKSAAKALCKAFARADQMSRKILTERLASVSGESWEDLIVLAASLARISTSGRLLLDAMVDALNRESLEQKCVQLWARSRLLEARDVLVFCFGYKKDALT